MTNLWTDCHYQYTTSLEMCQGRYPQRRFLWINVLSVKRRSPKFGGEVNIYASPPNVSKKHGNNMKEEKTEEGSRKEPTDSKMPDEVRETIMKTVITWPRWYRRASNIKFPSFKGESKCETCGGPIGVCTFGQIKRFCHKTCRLYRHGSKHRKSS